MKDQKLEKKARRGHKESQYQLGLKYLNGEGYIKDQNIAEKWFKKAAKKKHGGAYYETALLKLNQEAYDTALTLFHKSVKYKFPKGYKMLGTMYRGDYDPMMEDKKKSAEMLYVYYRFDKFDALEPLLSVFTKKTFKTVKDMKKFLDEALSFGLLKAKYFIGLMHLTENKYKDFNKALQYLESYYDATADANAAKVLYYLYAPKEEKYPGFKKKDLGKARMYLKQMIESDGTLEGTEFIKSDGVYLNPQAVPLRPFLERTITNMKTSLAIDQTFAETVSLEAFDVTMEFNVETVYDYLGKWTYKQKVVEEETVEKEIIKKEKVKKGFKTTGKVKIPRRVQEIEKKKVVYDKEEPFEKSGQIEPYTTEFIKIESLRDLVTKMACEDYMLSFNAPLTPKQIETEIMKQIRKDFKKPKKSRKVKKSFTFEHIYLVKPVLHIKYAYKRQFFEETLPLENKKDLRRLPFPLDRKFKGTLKRFAFRQNFLKLSQYLLTLLFVGVFGYTLYTEPFLGLYANQALLDLANGLIYYGAVGVVGLLIAFIFHRYLKFKPIDNDTFIIHYDDATLELLRKTKVLNVFRWLIRFLPVAGIAAYYYLTFLN